MKFQIILLITIFCLIALTAYSENFLLGAYLYNKNIHPEAHHRTLSMSMSAAGFNAAICDAQDNKDPLGVTSMLDYMNQYGINGILEDFIFDPPTNTYGAKTLSSGNYLRFEAEYSDSSSVSTFDAASPDNYFYKSSNWNGQRLGGRNLLNDASFSNKYYWQVNNGQSGYAYQDLSYKFAQPNNLNQYRRIGQEFRFPKTRLGDNNYLFNNNILDVTFSMRCDGLDSIPNNTVLAKVSLTSKGQYTNSPDPTVIIPHDYDVNTSCDTTFVTKEMYLNSPPDPGHPQNRLITISVPILRLDSNNLLLDGPNFDKCLKNLIPNLYWYGHGTLKLDYIDFEDKLHKDYTSQNAILAQIRTFGLPYLYGYDEPVQGQFDSFDKISNYWEAHGNTTQLIAAINEPVKVVKTNYANELYRHRQAYIDAVKPQTVVIDDYPFRGGRVPNWTDTTSVNFVQDYISDMCEEYRYYKEKCKAERSNFIAVSQTYGKWNPTTGIWNVLYPPDKVMKSLQFLPLCYQAKGIIDFKFEGAISSSDTVSTGLMNSYLNQYYNPTQYTAIRDANKKIQTYGSLLNSNCFEWLGAHSIMTVSPSFDVSRVLLDSLYVPSITNPSLYQGWVQVGFYKKDNASPYFMLVNRRAIYPNNGVNLNTISPVSTIPLQTYNNSYQSAPSQTIRLFPNAEALSCIGSSLAYYDPYDSTLYRQIFQYIDVPLEPGDGKLVQMVGTLPSTVIANASISGVGYLQGNITISNNANVNLGQNSNVTLLPDANITINEGSTLTISGHLTGSANTAIINNGGTLILTGSSVLDNVSLQGEFNITNNASVIITNNSTVTLTPQSQINIDYGSTLTINGQLTVGDNAGIYINGGNLFMDSQHQSCTMGTNAVIKVQSSDMSGENGTLRISNTSFDVATDVISWNGIQAKNALDVAIDNCEINNALGGVYSEDSNLRLTNNSYVIPHLQYNGLPYQSAGVFVFNTVPGKVTIITNNNIDKKFLGDNSVTPATSRAVGIRIMGRNETLTIQGYSFHNLHDGIYLVNTFNPADSISECSFNNCVNGIYLMTGFYSGKITDCSFSQVGTQNQMVGINLMNTAPIIRNCEFNNLLGCGIRTAQSTYIGREGITNCTFNNCATGIESYYSSFRIINSAFNYNNIGLLCHAGANLNISMSAHNVFNNDSANIKFYDTHPYQAYLQLIEGHNDFYHHLNSATNDKTYDFAFDNNYFNSMFLAAIKVDSNWFCDDDVRVTPANFTSYVNINEYDPNPNTHLVINPNSRFLQALQYEEEQEYGLAYSLYKDILNDPLEGEKEYLGSCVDGMYRISLDKEYPVTENINYFDEKTLQYAITDPYLCKLLNSYLVKEFIVGKDFQSAIDLIQPRIDNPVSAIDSLRAVLDLEMILQLATFEDNKRPVTTTYSQYKYADIATFSTKHKEHWDEMIKLLNKGEEVSPPIPTIVTLYQNYPNPFNPSTTISFSVPKESDVKIRMYNIKGQMVKELCNRKMARGFHRLVWDGRNEQNKTAGSGIYLIRLEAKDKVITQKAMMLK